MKPLFGIFKNKMPNYIVFGLSILNEKKDFSIAVILLDYRIEVGFYK